MDPDEIDIKPTISANDVPDKSSLSTAASVGKLKQSRYEDVWPEDVHAAFMEAVALYPPMGKRRLKYYRVTHESDHFPDSNQAKSFGRCQLIQSYILEKTGKNRSRKQVSSHLQRLKKIHKDNPAMRPLFSERSQPPPEHYSAPQAIAISSQDIFANISFSTRHLKSDFDLTLNLQNTDNKADGSTSSYASQAVSSFNGSSCNTFDLSTTFYNQPSPLSSQELLPLQQYPAGILQSSSDGDYLSEFQDPSLFTDVVNGTRTSSAFNTSAFSISMRRFASKLPTLGRQADSGPMAHFPRAAHSPAFQPTNQQWPGAHDGLVDGIPYNSPLTLVQPVFHAPFHYPQLIPLEKQRLDPGLACDWMWPQTPDIPLGPRSEGDFGEVHLRYPATTNQYNPTNPLKVNSPWSYSSPCESEVLRLPRGISYSYAVATPTTLSDDDSKENTNEFPGQAVSTSSEYLATPPVIRPTPVYPNSYIHSDVHADRHTPPTPSPL